MCENCKHYEKENEFVGKCYKIKMMVMPDTEVDEAKDFLSYIYLKVRKEFSCNQIEQ